MLQTAQHEPAIYHAVVALASLSETMLRGQQEHAHEGEERTPAIFAIRQQNRAISQLRRRLQDTPDSSTEILLVMCVLFICFDMFQNKLRAALRQMSIGISLSLDWSKKRRVASPQSSFLDARSCSPPQPLQEIFGRIMLQTILFGKQIRWRSFERMLAANPPSSTIS